MTYRSRYYTTLQPVAVLDVLMADETNPRSLDFQLGHLADLYAKLPRHMPEDLHAMRNALASVAQLRFAERWTIRLPACAAATRIPDERGAWTGFLKELGNLLPSWSNNLSNTYFSHARTFPITIGE